MITINRLKEVIEYDIETGIFVWIKPYRRNILVGSSAGHLNKSGYVYIRIDGNRYLAHRLAWFYVFGKFPDMQIDHINLKKNDNRIVNLREASRYENQANRSKNRNNTSGFKGVFYRPDINKWMAQCRSNGKQYYLGCFTSPTEASKAYNEFAINNHKDFCRLI